MQHKQVVLFIVFCTIHFFACFSLAQVSEPIDQVLSDALTKYRINIGLILDRSIIRKSLSNQLVLQNAVASGSCIQQTQTIQIVQRLSSETLSQSLIFDDCNNNKSIFTIIQSQDAPVVLTLADWLNGNWKLAEMKSYRLQLSHKKLFIEKKWVVRASGTWLQVHFDYTDVPDPDIPTDIARLNFEELKTETKLQRNYYIDVGRISPSINLRFENVLVGAPNSKEAFLQTNFFDHLSEISPKNFASQYQSYLTNIVFKSVQNAIGSIPLVLPGL